MTDQAQKNKDRLLNAIQNLKDCALGMNAPYMPFCYSCSSETHNWDDKKFGEFIDTLVGYAPNCVYYRPELERPLYLFYSLTIKYISAACNSSEQTFVSLRKIAKVTEKKPGITNLSPNDVLLPSGSSMFATELIEYIAYETAEAIADYVEKNHLSSMALTVFH